MSTPDIEKKLAEVARLCRKAKVTERPLPEPQPEQKRWFTRALDVLLSGEPMVCPDCNGTGEPLCLRGGWVEFVWWKGERVQACHVCKGAGRI